MSLFFFSHFKMLIFSASGFQIPMSNRAERSMNTHVMIHKYFWFIHVYSCIFFASKAAKPSARSAAGIYMKRYAVVKCGNLLSLNRQFNVFGRANRHSCVAIPMESFNEINGIVQRNQWNRWTKPMDSFPENGGLAWHNWQTDEQKLTRHSMNGQKLP